MVRGGAVVTDVGVESSGVGVVPGDSDTVRRPRQEKTTLKAATSIVISHLVTSSSCL